jgi:hypothetical protein
MVRQSAQDKRAYLKAAGWTRQDRATGPNQSVELWVRPGLNRYGYQFGGQSLRSAVAAQKYREYKASNEPK